MIPGKAASMTLLPTTGAGRNERSAAALPRQREPFALPPDVVYLNCANLAPHLRAVTAAGKEALRRFRNPSEIQPRDWFKTSEEVRRAAARLMHSSPDNVALVPAVSYGVATAAANIPISRGQNVVVIAEQYPSNVYAWRDTAKAVGAELRTARRDPEDDWTDAVLDAVDEDTAVVAVPNYHWTDGARVDVGAVGERARAVGAALVLDVSQSFGASPIDVREVQPDFMISVGYKWQLGPYGLGYMYVSPRWWAAGRPLEASWLTRAKAEDFTTLVDYVDEYRDGARRFDMGGYPQLVIAPMALAALRQIHEWGIERIEASLERLTALLGDSADEMNCTALRPGKRARHFLGLRPRGGTTPELVERLKAARVQVSVRGDAIRVSPHVYNGMDDARRLIEILSS